MPKDRYEDYDSTAANNADVGGVAIQGSSSVALGDNALRELMSHTADHFAADTIASAATTDLGSKVAHHLTVTGTTAVTGFGTIKAGTKKSLRFAAALTLTHNATSLILPGGANIVTETGATAEVVSEGSGNWRMLFYQRPFIPPDFIGMVFDYAGATAPSGFLMCFGQNVSRTTYAALFAKISTTHGAGDGSTTFGLPDCRGRVVAGKDNMGGTSADRLTNQTGGLNGDTLGDTGGVETHTLTLAQSAAHSHAPNGATRFVVSDQNVSSNEFADPGGSGTTAILGSVLLNIATTTTSQGGNGAHNNVQPTIIFNKMMYAGV